MAANGGHFQDWTGRREIQRLLAEERTSVHQLVAVAARLRRWTTVRMMTFSSQLSSQ